MKVLYLQLHNRFGAETAYNSWAADVKEMYDWLPQQHIIKAIYWVLKHVQRKSRRLHVNVVQQESRVVMLIEGFGSLSFSMTVYIYYEFQFLFSIYDHLSLFPTFGTLMISVLLLLCTNLQVLPQSTLSQNYCISFSMICITHQWS